MIAPRDLAARAGAWRRWAWLPAALLLVPLALWRDRSVAPQLPRGRREVVFWHFWGGRDRAVVEALVRRFNESQDEHFVRAIAMPGHNLDLKFFLSVAGGDPPDVMNQDDPVVADWAARGALQPIAAVAGVAAERELAEWLLPAARQIGSYQGRLYAVCNGLDIRALYYDRARLEAAGLSAPRTLAQLDAVAEQLTPAPVEGLRPSFGYLPDPRRLWAWGIVFGGRFYDPATGQVLVDSPPIVRALEWMTSYSRRYGPDTVAAFRKGDQALAGAAFPLLEGRYALIMDGQRRVAELAAVEQAARGAGRPVPQLGVVPLPPPEGGVERAGWVNGNFFVVPRGARNAEGAWQFMQFWSGFGGHEAEAARICAAGGWLPASRAVIDQPRFQQHLEARPLLRTFVELAASDQQLPTPGVPGASYFYNEVIAAAEDAMYRGVEPRTALAGAQLRIAARLRALQAELALAPAAMVPADHDSVPARPAGGASPETARGAAGESP